MIDEAKEDTEMNNPLDESIQVRTMDIGQNEY